MSLTPEQLAEYEREATEFAKSIRSKDLDDVIEETKERFEILIKVLERRKLD